MSVTITLVTLFILLLFPFFFVLIYMLICQPRNALTIHDIINEQITYSCHTCISFSFHAVTPNAVYTTDISIHCCSLWETDIYTVVN